MMFGDGDCVVVALVDHDVEDQDSLELSSCGWLSKLGSLFGYPKY